MSEQIVMRDDEEDQRREFQAGRLSVWGYLDADDAVIETLEDGYGVMWDEIPTLVAMLTQLHTWRTEWEKQQEQEANGN